MSKAKTPSPLTAAEKRRQQTWHNMAPKLRHAVKRLQALIMRDATQTILELSYGIQLTPAVRLMPNLQYVINPQPQEKFAFRPRAIPDAVVVGAKLSVDLFTLAGV